jgi:hypothetical protein
VSAFHAALPPMIKNPNAYELKEIMDDLPKHVWDSSAEPPVVKTLKGLIIEGQKHPLARKAVKVSMKRKKIDKSKKRVDGVSA